MSAGAGRSCRAGETSTGARRNAPFVDSYRWSGAARRRWSSVQAANHRQVPGASNAARADVQSPRRPNALPCHSQTTVSAFDGFVSRAAAFAAALAWSLVRVGVVGDLVDAPDLRIFVDQFGLRIA